MQSFNDISIHEIDVVMMQSKNSFDEYQKMNAYDKANFLESIANEIINCGDTLLNQAALETNLSIARLQSERSRTTNQLIMFAEMLRKGNWVEATIDTENTDRNPPKPDLRKMLFPLGPVIVFGASNFPFAYSTAGGDTASVLAAGCSVIIKAHPAHPATSQMVFEAIQTAIQKCNMPKHLVQHVFGASFEVSKALVQHPIAKAVGFTGSYTGGTALYQYAAKRKHPIPVFAEMGSVNPVVFLPKTIKENATSLANLYVNSITLGMGQFCTNPGLLMAIDNDDLRFFTDKLSEELAAVVPAKMLHEGIYKAYNDKKAKALTIPHVEEIHYQLKEEQALLPAPTIATVAAKYFLENPILGEEIFGPYSLLVKCADIEELIRVLLSVEGQLTTTLMGTENDFSEYSNLIQVAQSVAGRVVFNGVPTGVEVCTSMVHGGPSPATTDSRFTAVGIDAVKRWVRPVCFQNCPDYLLPEELQRNNPKQILRRVNGEITADMG